MQRSNLHMLSAFLVIASIPAVAQVQSVKRLPATPAVPATPAPSTAPTGKQHIIVQGGLSAPDKPTEEIGPKQGDDPQARNGMLAIGPKQDDPRSPGTSVMGRPDDEDDDPKARCIPVREVR